MQTAVATTDASFARPKPAPRITRSRLIGLFLRFVVCAAILTAIWLGASYAVARKLTSRPRPFFEEPPPDVPWAKIEGFRLKTSDGEELGGWFAPGKEKSPVAVLFHGFQGNRGAMLDNASLVHGLGYSVVLVSLRAHGDSSGDLVDFGWSNKHDVLAAVEWAEKRCPKSRVIVWGESLGAASAMFAIPELKNRVAGYILECPYRDLHTAMRNRCQKYLPPPLDLFADEGLRITGRWVLPECDEIAPIEFLAKAPPATPVLIVGGAEDVLSKPNELRDLYYRIPAQANLVFLDGGHAHLRKANPPEYDKEMQQFLKRFQK